MSILLLKTGKNDPAGFYHFYKDPVNNPPADTLREAGVLLREIGSNTSLMIWRDRRYPSGLRRGITHDERISSERAKKYPLLMMSNHGRWRMHSQGDDICWTREALPAKSPDRMVINMSLCGLTPRPPL